MGEFRVHHVRFFEFEPKAIHCVAYEKRTQRIAVSRSDGSIEVWSVRDNWYQEKIIHGCEGRSVEAVVWQNKRLFTAGLDGNVTEYDLLRLQPQTSVSSNAGPVWCLTCNASDTCLAAGTEDGCVVLFDTQSGCLEYLKAFDKQDGRILSIVWQSEEGIIVTGGVNSIRLWSVNSGHALQRLTLGKAEQNKDTIVWCVGVMSDMTIVSGDSRGKTCFWNGKQGTLIRSVQSHKADVLCLAINEDNSSVFTSGVDPAVTQFDYTSSQPDSDWRMWVRTAVRSQHTHDVRALCMAGNYLVSGGVDTYLIWNNTGLVKGLKLWRRLQAIPHQPLVATARNARLIMLQYPNHLEVWKLGHTTETSDKNGDILPLRSNPVKMLQLKTKAGSSLVCCTISDAGDLLAYADTETVRIYRLNIEDQDLITPKVSLRKVLCGGEDPFPPAHRLAFTPDSAVLVSATCDRAVQLIALQEDGASVTHTFPVHSDSIHLLAVSPDGNFVAASDHSCNISVYSIKTLQYVCSLPKYSCQATALTFNFNSEELVVAYSDQMVYEFDVTTQEYTEWCKKNSKIFPTQWLKRNSKISHLSVNLRNPNHLILQDEQMFCILDKSQPFPDKDTSLYSKRSWQQGHTESHKPHPFHICNKYKYLMYLDTLESDWLVAVERTPMALTDILPPTLKQKKFGT